MCIVCNIETLRSLREKYGNITIKELVEKLNEKPVNYEVDLSVEQWDVIIHLLEQADTISDTKGNIFAVTAECIRQQQP